ncbi:MAG: AAA family ATPase [Anaerolineaceae bacterium]|nr:MAG: AAA family ATPase [Anaerolineaceae bacterium]
MKTIAIANQRAGVGKTSTTLSLGMAIAESETRVLLVDMDPLGALSAACGLEETEGASLAEVIGGSRPGELGMWDILQEILPDHDCYLAPSDLALAQSELGLNFRMSRESVLRNALETVESDFDLALIDCPSSLGMLTVNALNSAQTVLIPIRPEIPEIRAVSLFLAQLDRFKEEINPDLDTLGVLITSYNPALEHHIKAIDTMREVGLPLITIGIDEFLEGDHPAKIEDAKPINIPDNPETRRQLVELIKQWLAGWRAWEPTDSDQ